MQPVGQAVAVFEAERHQPFLPRAQRCAVGAFAGACSIGSPPVTTSRRWPRASIRAATSYTASVT